MTKERIGFIGVGLMGHGMAKNIVSKGWPLTIMGHRNRAPVEDLLKAGAAEAKTARELAEKSDIIFLCVTGSPEVETLVNGPDGIAKAARKGLVIVDCSTSNPVSTRALAVQMQALGVDYADAPLGRTPKEAAEGTLDAMIGADEAVFERIRPVVGAWAGKIVRIGDVGSGHAMKLVNNFLSMGYAALYSEALTVGQKAGLDPAVIDSVIRGGRMDCGFYQTFFKYVLERDENAHRFSIRNAHKDVRYMALMATELGVPNPMGAAIRNVFAQAEATGHGDKMVPMLSDVVSNLSGVKLKTE